MHVLLIGHGTATRTQLRAIATSLKARGVRTSAYFDEDLLRINQARELPEADALVIGLSRESRDPRSQAHAIEEDIAKRTSGLMRPMPCCVICDEDGNVSAPFLVTLGSHVSLVVARKLDASCNVTEICERAKPLYIEDISAGAAAIAHEIMQLHPVACAK